MFILLVASLLSAAGSAFAFATPWEPKIQPPPPMDEALRQRIDTANQVLRSPLLWSERNPGLAVLSAWVPGDHNPHLNAIRSLVRTNHPDAAVALVEVLEDKSSPFRRDAMIGLSRLRSLVAIEPLIEAFDDSDHDIARVAAQVLGLIISKRLRIAGKAGPTPELAELIPPSVEALTRLLRESPAPESRVASLHGLVWIGTNEAMTSAFSLAVEDKHYLVRCGLLTTSRDFISMQRGPSATRFPIRQLLRNSLDPDSMDASPGVLFRAFYQQRYSSISSESNCVDVHQSAMRELAWMHDPEAKSSLMRASRSSAPELRATAAFGLSNYADDKSRAAVVSALSDPLWGVRKSAIEGLGKSKHPGADALLAKTLRNGSRLDRREAARSLAGSFGASVPLIEAFADPAVEVRNESEVALLRSVEVVADLEALLARLGDPAPNQAKPRSLEANRRKVEKELEKWRLERRAAERALGEGLSNRDPRVRIRSARVLARYTSEESLSLLLDAVAADVSPKSEAAALALGLRGDIRARQTLERAADSGAGDLAVAAVRALQDLREPASLPLLREIASVGRSERLSAAARYAVAILEGRTRRSPPTP